MSHKKENTLNYRKFESAQLKPTNFLKRDLASYDTYSIFIFFLHRGSNKYFEPWKFYIFTFPSTRSSVFVKMLSSLIFSSLGSVQAGSSASAILKSSMANLYSSWNLYAYSGMIMNRESLREFASSISNCKLLPNELKCMPESMVWFSSSNMESK